MSTRVEEITYADEERTAHFQTRISSRRARNAGDPRLKVSFESRVRRNGGIINIGFKYWTVHQFLPNSPSSLTLVDDMLDMLCHYRRVIENFRSHRNEIVEILAGLAREDGDGMEDTVKEVLFRMAYDNDEEEFEDEMPTFEEEFEDEMSTFEEEFEDEISTFEEENADVEVAAGGDPVNLTTVKYDGSQSKECYDEKTCGICLVDFVDGVEVNKLNCLHIFHVDCLCKWLQKSKSCPFCRVDVSKGHTDY